MTVTIDASFIRRFKIGDNMVYTSEILEELYLNNKELLIKPKVLLNTSLIDAALYDFLRRIREHRREFQYLDVNTRQKIRRMNIDKVRGLKQHITKFRHYSLLGKSPYVYDQLSALNALRNRVHIQNEDSSFEADERAAFSKAWLLHSEKCTEYVLRYLSTKYPRNKRHVKDINLPWCAHFNDDLTPRQ